jgi:DNA repair protein RadC
MTPAPAYISQLSDVDLLGKLIGTQESRRLYQGSLQPLFSASVADDGPHEVCAVARELVRRWLDEELRRECSLSSPGSVRDHLRLIFTGQEHESFVVMFLDAQNRLIASEELFRGTLTQTSVYPREIVKEALRRNAAALIFAHNHPSGVAEPSRADEMLTSSLKQALALVDVRVLDHFIVAGSTTLSFAERGLL